jgi:hypothetical protein
MHNQVPNTRRIGATGYRKYSSALCFPTWKKLKISSPLDTTARPPQTVATFAPQRRAFCNALAARRQTKAAARATMAARPREMPTRVRPGCVREITSATMQNNPHSPIAHAMSTRMIALKRIPAGTTDPDDAVS